MLWEFYGLFKVGFSVLESDGFVVVINAFFGCFNTFGTGEFEPISRRRTNVSFMFAGQSVFFDGSGKW